MTARVVENTRCIERDFHHRMELPEAFSTVHEGEDAPPPFAFASLGLYRNKGVDLEVMGYRAPFEIRADDLLEVILLSQGFMLTSLSSRDDVAGAAGEARARWTSEGIDRIGRFYSVKWGQRVFLLGESADATAGESALTALGSVVSSFRALGDVAGPYAEPMRRLTGREPNGWGASLPMCWKVATRTKESALTAELPSVPPATSPIAAKLSLDLLPAAAVKTPVAAAATHIDRIKAEAAEPEGGELETETALPPFSKRWSLSCKVAPSLGELHMKVLKNQRAWVVASVWTLARGEAPLEWMQARRALDIVTDTIEV